MSEKRQSAGKGNRISGSSNWRKGLEKMCSKAAGIDLGSREHYVAVPAGSSPEPVQRFGCTTAELRRMADWLKSCGIERVAMESTGVYWIPVYEVLEEAGFEVSLVDARQVKNVPGRKTDVLDCQWQQELHSYGLLRGCFMPEERIKVLRSYWRQRQGLVESCTRQIQLMQKALEQMNVQLHKVVSDVTGTTGLAIIRAILAGERTPQKLAALKNYRVKSSEEKIAEALHGNFRREHMFALKQALELYDVYREKMRDCDVELQRYLSTLESKVAVKTLPAPRAAADSKNKTAFDLRRELVRISGVDLTRIEGVNTLTAQTIIAEVGVDMSRFPTEKHFASWLALCPSLKKTGGKVKSSRTRRAQNRAAHALRVAAQSLHGSKGYLGAYYRRMRGRLGAPKAITAAAHKMARLIYRMLRHGEEYVAKTQRHYEEQYRQRQIKNLHRQAQILGFEISETVKA